MRHTTLAVFLAASFTLPVSHAMVGGFAGNPFVTVLGMFTALSGPRLAVHTAGSDCSGTRRGLVCAGKYVASAALLVVGTFVADGQSQMEMQFRPLDPAEYPELGDAVATYNAELSRLNALQQTLMAEIAANPRMDAQARFSELTALLSPETRLIASQHARSLVQQINGVR